MATKKCSACGGDGDCYDSSCVDGKHESGARRCRTCNGSDDCRVCDGTGREFVVE